MLGGSREIQSDFGKIILANASLPQKDYEKETMVTGYMCGAQEKRSSDPKDGNDENGTSLKDSAICRNKNDQEWKRMQATIHEDI